MRILIADDERQLVSGLTKYLENAGHEVCQVITGGLDVLPAYDRFHPEVVLMDVMMPRFNGITISHALISRNASIKLILCSGALAADHPFVTGSGASCFLRKPFTFSEAKQLIESVAATPQVVAA